LDLRIFRNRFCARGNFQARAGEGMARKNVGRRGAYQKKSAPSALLRVGIALVAIAVLALMWVALNPARGGTPQIQVNTERIDLGVQPFERRVRADFQLTNTGTGTLTLQVPRAATLLEGC
jgi:hypothetical protein